MSIKQAYLLEVERETANTRAMLKNIQDQHLDYKPHEKSFTLGQLAAHIVELHNWVAQALSISELNFATDYQPLIAHSADALREALEAAYQKNIDQINSMTEEQWMEMWTMKHGDHVIATMPKIGTMRYVIMNHLIHHRGQLSVYLRLNNIPVPGIFGPSADEQQG